LPGVAQWSSLEQSVLNIQTQNDPLHQSGHHYSESLQITPDGYGENGSRKRTKPIHHQPLFNQDELTGRHNMKETHPI